VLDEHWQRVFDSALKTARLSWYWFDQKDSSIFSHFHFFDTPVKTTEMHQPLFLPDVTNVFLFSRMFAEVARKRTKDTDNFSCHGIQ
jgi:hypothetical protein